MSHSSLTPSGTRLRTTWIVAIAGLALLAGGLAIAQDTSAATVNAVQTYIWGNTTDIPAGSNAAQTVDRLNHTWVPTPHDEVSDTPFTDNITVIPEEGLLLVGIEYDATNPPVDFIRFRLIDEATLQNQDPTEHVYEFEVGGSPNEDEQNVFPATGSIPIQESGSGTFSYNTGVSPGPDGTTGEDGCGGSGTADLSDPPPRPCWFLIELQNPDPDISDGTPTAGVNYVMEVEVQDQDGKDEELEEFVNNNGNDEARTLRMARSVVSIQQARFTTRTVDTNKGTTIEAGRSATLNLTLRTQADARGRSPNWGDVDAWLCAFEDDEATDPDDPYTGFSALKTTQSDLPNQGAWDSPPACEFLNFPTHNGSGDANAINITDVELQDGTGEGDDTRFLEATFTIDPAQLELTGSEFIDQFFFRMVLRDPVGNILQQDQTDSDPGTFAVAKFDFEQDLQEITAGTGDEVPPLGDFQDNDGCFQSGTEDDSPGGASSPPGNNSASSPCFIGLDFAPPDQTFTFPITIENYANVEDTIRIELFDANDPGETSWSIGVESGGTSANEEIEVTVPAAQPTGSGSVSRSTVSPGVAQFDVTITPGSSALAGPAEPTRNFASLTQGFRSLRIEATSQGGNAPPTDERWVQAQLVQNAQGAIELGPDGTSETTIEAKTDEFNKTALTVRNTGNTNGPFKIKLAGSASDRCFAPNQEPNDPSKIEIDVLEAGGSEPPQEGTAISPGSTQDFTFRVRPGEGVPIGSYDCELTFAADPAGDGGDPVSLVTSQPTVNVNVVGTPNIQIWDVRGVDDEQVNITGDSVTITVPPDKQTHDVFLYLENVGDVALEPELVSVTQGDETFIVSDRFGLDGAWRGTNKTGRELSRSTMASPFDLPVSDGDEADQTRIRDLFDFDQRLPGGFAPASDAVNRTSDGDRWYCAGDDGPDQGSDDRVVCQLHLFYDLRNKFPVNGDRVVTRFKWADAGGAGEASETTVRLAVRHPGTVEVDSVSEKTLAPGSDTTVEFDASLTDQHRFDPDATSVDADLEFTFDGQKCTFSAGSGQVSSTSESLSEAAFRPTIRIADTSGSSPCTVDGSGSTFDVTLPGTGPLQVGLQVGDENGTRLRQIHPATIQVVDANVGTVAEPSSFTLEPSDELNADGDQFARLFFDAGNDGDDFPSESEGLLLTRKSTTNALEPFVDCDLGSDAVSTNDSALSWTVLPAVERSAPSFEQDADEENQIDAQETIKGLLLDTEDSGNDAQPAIIGEVTLWGWDDDATQGDGLNWTEGWNPLAMRIVDDQGNPARVGDGSNAISLELDLRFEIRDGSNDEITDTYHLSTEDNTIRARPMGNGFYRVEVYLPANLNAADLEARDDVSNPQLADYTGTDTDSQSVAYEAFALHASISSGQSTGGEELTGDAYWQLGDLGMITPASDSGTSDAGTLGTSSIDVGIDAARDRVRLTQGRVSEDDDVQYLHAAPQFLDPLMESQAPGAADWGTGAGAQDYGLFLMEEDSRPEDSPSGFENQPVASNFRDHTFSPYTQGDVELIVDGNNRLGVPGGQTYSLDPVEQGNASTEGLYSAFFFLPDTGRDTFTWFTQLNIDEDTQDGREFFDIIQTIKTDEDLEPSSNGLPMPLCLREPVGAFPEADDPSGDFDLDDREIRTIVDLRTVPGLLVDRGEFAMAPLIQHDTEEGIHFEVNQGATFTVIGQSLLSLDASQLPTTGETGVPIQLAVSPSPASAVQEVTARLTQEGSLIDSATLTDSDGDGVWNGTVQSDTNGTHTLRVIATDTAGATEPAQVSMDIQENLPPTITIVRPSATGGERAMRPNGTVEATITDRSIFAGAISVEQKITSGDGDQGTVLSDADVSFDSLTDQPTVGDHSVTLNFTDVSTGTAYVNISGVPAENMTASISGGAATGSIRFNTSGAATVTVQTNGTDGVDSSFDVQVASTSDDGFSQVDLPSGAISCQQTSCSLSWSPSGLSEGSTLSFRVIAEISADDSATKGPIDVTVDGTQPTVDVLIGSPKVTGTPTRVGPATSVTVDASDDILVGSITVAASQGGVQAGSRTFSGGQESVSGTVSQLSEIGLSSSGSATLNVTVTDIAGNERVRQVDVQVDGQGPTLQSASADCGGTTQFSVDASDGAGIEQVQVSVQGPGSTSFTGKTMTQGSGGSYTASHAASETGTLEYFFRATDRLGNAATLGSQGSPRSCEVTEVAENQPPTVEIVRPSQNVNVSGTFEIEVELSDPDTGDTPTLDSVSASPASGSPVSIDLPDSGTTIPVDSTQLPEGRATIEITASDGTDTGSTTLVVVVDNLPDAGACPGAGPLTIGEDVEVCFNYSTGANVTGLTVSLIRNGETVGTQTLEPSETGRYRTTFSISEAGSYALRIQADREDGTSEETTTEPFQVQSAAGVIGDEPLGRFITTLVLGVVTVGMAAFAGFRRWGQ